MEQKVFSGDLWGLPADPPGTAICTLAMTGLQRVGSRGQYPAPVGVSALVGSAGWGDWQFSPGPTPLSGQPHIRGGAQFFAQAPYQQTSSSTGMAFKSNGWVKLTGYAGFDSNGNITFLQLDFRTDPGPPYWLHDIAETLVLTTVSTVADVVREQAGEPASTPVFTMTAGSWTPHQSNFPTLI